MNTFNYNPIIEILKERFKSHPHRHPKTTWQEVEEKLNGNVNALQTLQKMEETGGEPDVVEFKNTSEFIFVDCSKESPNRRSLCYDQDALDARKQNKPESSVLQKCQEIGIELLDETLYMELQSIEDFDLKTSSWLKTPVEIRSKKGAIFGDKRYGRTFIYHNGADSYYASIGFRGMLIL